MCFNMCKTCISKGFEPRFAVILSFNQFGFKKVAIYIKNKLYVGADILAGELLPGKVDK